MFIRDRKDLLEEIKRKAPGTKPKKEDKTKQSDTCLIIEEIKATTLDLQAQIVQLQKSKSTLHDSISKLNQTDSQIMTDLAEFNENMIVKDNLLKDFLKIMTEKDKRE